MTLITAFLLSSLHEKHKMRRRSRERARNKVYTESEACMPRTVRGKSQGKKYEGKKTSTGARRARCAFLCPWYKLLAPLKRSFGATLRSYSRLKQSFTRILFGWSLASSTLFPVTRQEIKRGNYVILVSRGAAKRQEVCGTGTVYVQLRIQGNKFSNVRLRLQPPGAAWQIV